MSRKDVASSLPPAPNRPPIRRRAAYPAEDRHRVMRAVWLTSVDPWRLRFGVMLTLSVVIAVIGLRADSPALVIGAMLIAPLMTPVVGFSVALSMGWARRMARTAATVGVASAGAVVLAWLLAAVLPSGASPLTHEIVSRTAPSMLDLFVALAAGAAGAYATLREDTSAALPGVAVAVALVPPLATIGMTLQLHQFGLAKGAILLYVANLAAIVLASVAVLLVSGFVPLPRLTQVKKRVAAGTIAVAAATVLLAVVLSAGLRHTVDQATALTAVNDEVVRWLGSGSELQIRHVSVDGARVVVELAGSTPPPPTSALAGALVSSVGPDASVQVRWSQRTTDTAPAVAAPGSTAVAEGDGDGEAFRSQAEAWLSAGSASGSQIVSLKLTGDELVVEVGGPVAPPQARALATAVASARGRPTKVTVRWTPRQEFAASSDAAPLAADATLRARQTVDSWARGHPVVVVVLNVSVANGVTTVDLAAEAAPADVDLLVATLKSRVGTSVVVRLAPLQRISPGTP